MVVQASCIKTLCEEGEYALPLIHHKVSWKGEIPSPLHFSLPVSGGRVDSGVMKAGELSLPLTSFSTQEIGSWTSPGHHSRTGPAGIGVGEQDPRA